MLPDLHCHTTASDGLLQPQALVDAAAAAGVTHLAITDHDTTLAYEVLGKLPAGLQLISGIEFSTQWHNIGVHVVGLAFDREHPVIREAVVAQTARREQRAERIAEVLARKGISGCLEGARNLAGRKAVGRPHFAQHLVNIGAVRTVNEAFRKHLGNGKPGDVRQVWPPLEEAVGWILAAGGIPVLAHPSKYDLTRTRLGILLDEFAAAGGRAVEVSSGLQPPNLTRDLAALCNQRGLLASVGSDFHQPGQPWARLGHYARLPEDCQPVWNSWD